MHCTCVQVVKSYLSVLLLLLSTGDDAIARKLRGTRQAVDESDDGEGVTWKKMNTQGVVVERGEFNLGGLRQQNLTLKILYGHLNPV